MNEDKPYDPPTPPPVHRATKKTSSLRVGETSLPGDAESTANEMISELNGRKNKSQQISVKINEDLPHSEGKAPVSHLQRPRVHSNGTHHTRKTGINGDNSYSDSRLYGSNSDPFYGSLGTSDQIQVQQEFVRDTAPIEDEHANGKVSQASELAWPTFSEFISRFLSSFFALVRRVEQRFVGSIFSLLVAPVLIVWSMGGISIVTIYASNVTTLSHIYFANALLMVLFVVTELTVIVSEFAMKQMLKYQIAWRLVFSTIPAKEFIDACQGSFGSAGRLIWWLLMGFRISTVLLAFLSEWVEVDTQYGTFDCIWPSYSSNTFDGFAVSQDLISGDIDSSLITVYGLPMANGIIAGLGPWPLEGSLTFESLSISGPGPVFALRVDCDPVVSPWNGTNLTALGSGSSVLGVFSGQNSFNANVQIYLPSSGFKSSNTGSNWVKQECRIDGITGQGQWTTKYHTDQWLKISGPEVSSLQLGNYLFDNAATSTIFIDRVIETLRQQILSSAGQGSASQQNRLLSQQITTSITNILNNTWFAPSEKVSYSRFMSWAVLPDGYYYPNLTARGLAAGLGAVAHKVLMQYDRNQVQSCVYSGSSGAGMLKFNQALVYTSLGLVGSVMLSFIFYSMASWLLYRVDAKHHGLFQMSARNMVLEQRRLFFMSSWLTRISDFGTNQIMSMETMKEERIRFGERRETTSDKAGILVIGPSYSTVKIRRNRLYFNADMDLIDYKPEK